MQLTSGGPSRGWPPRGDLVVRMIMMIMLMIIIMIIMIFEEKNLCGDIGGTLGSAGESRGDILRGPENMMIVMMVLMMSTSMMMTSMSKMMVMMSMKMRRKM